jgi:hypothetical protein
MRMPQLTKNEIAGLAYPSREKDDAPLLLVVSPPTPRKPESSGGNCTQPGMLGPVIAPPDTETAWLVYSRRSSRTTRTGT